MYVVTEYQYQQLRCRYPEDEVIRQEIGNQTLSDHEEEADQTHSEVKE